MNEIQSYIHKRSKGVFKDIGEIVAYFLNRSDEGAQ